MKNVLRATAVAIGVGIGIVSFGGVAQAWEESSHASSACVGGVVAVTVSFTNDEPATEQRAIVVSASDDQSHETATWGNGQAEITVPGGETVTGTINTHSATATGGNVRITERWANGGADHDEVVVGYAPHDCTPAPPVSALRATTRGTGACDTTTGGSFVSWSVTNTGEIAVRAMSTDLPGGTNQTLIGPGETRSMPTLHRSGAYAVAGYTVSVKATDDRTLTLHGTLAPPLTGACTVVTPLTSPPPSTVKPPPVSGVTKTPPPTTPPAVPTSTVRAATATLPFTGGSSAPLTVAGLAVLSLGLLAIGATATRTAGLRRVGLAMIRNRTSR